MLAEIYREDILPWLLIAGGVIVLLLVLRLIVRRFNATTHDPRQAPPGRTRGRDLNYPDR